MSRVTSAEQTNRSANLLVPAERRLFRRRLIIIGSIFLLYIGGYCWFIRSHVYRGFSSNEIQISDSILDGGLLCIFYPALCLDVRYIGFYRLPPVVTGFVRVRASDRTAIEGIHPFPFDTVGEAYLDFQDKQRNNQ